MHHRFTFLATLCASLIVTPLMGQQGETPGRLGGSQIAFQYTGRVSIDFIKGTGIVYGYVTQLAGVPRANLFSGFPGESTAYVTFQADIAIQPMSGNGELGPNYFAVLPSAVVPGPFRLYYHASPKREWSDPASFTQGSLVATFLREGEQFALIGAIATNTASAALDSSASFTVRGVEVNFGKLVRNGVTNITTANTVALPGSPALAPIFAFAGYALAIGN